LFHLYGALLGCAMKSPVSTACRSGNGWASCCSDDVQSVAIPEMAEMLELARQPETWLAACLQLMPICSDRRSRRKARKPMLPSH
jgi:hypothetical protein